MDFLNACSYRLFLSTCSLLDFSCRANFPSPRFAQNSLAMLTRKLHGKYKEKES